MIFWWLIACSFRHFSLVRCVDTDRWTMYLYVNECLHFCHRTGDCHNVGAKCTIQPSAQCPSKENRRRQSCHTTTTTTTCTIYTLSLYRHCILYFPRTGWGRVFCVCSGEFPPSSFILHFHLSLSLSLIAVFIKIFTIDTSILVSTTTLRDQYTFVVQFFILFSNCLKTFWMISFCSSSPVPFLSSENIFTFAGHLHIHRTSSAPNMSTSASSTHLLSLPDSRKFPIGLEEEFSHPQSRNSSASHICYHCCIGQRRSSFEDLFRVKLSLPVV